MSAAAPVTSFIDADRRERPLSLVRARHNVRVTGNAGADACSISPWAAVGLVLAFPSCSRFAALIKLTSAGRSVAQTRVGLDVACLRTRAGNTRRHIDPGGQPFTMYSSARCSRPGGRIPKRGPPR